MPSKHSSYGAGHRCPWQGATPGGQPATLRAHPNATAYFGAEPRGTGKIPGKRKLTLHLLYSQEHLASLMWICHPQQTLKCTWADIPALRKKTTYHAVCRYHLHICSDRLPERHYKGRRYPIPGQAGQEGGYKTSPVMITNPDELQIRTAHTGAQRKQVCFSHGSINKHCENFTIVKSTLAISTFPSKQRILCGGKHTTSTPASPRIVRA